MAAMRRLMLLRHAKSAWPANTADRDRPLATRGREAAPVMGRYLAEELLLPDLVMISPAKRTAETWELVKPMLPETIEKYHTSIAELFRKIRENINGDKVTLSQRLNDLAIEVRSFYEMVERNTISLLQETRELKANVKKIDYREKIVRASRWIDEYIIPLNKILDINHSTSVANKLYEISEYSNKYRLNFDDENSRVQFEKLYFQLIQVNDNLLRQSKILTNELLPLIERIRTESIILTGWITYLKNPYKRAAYLCELNGIDLQAESNTAMPGDFLMQQMEWREALEEAKAAKDIDALDALNGDLQNARKAEVARIGENLDAHDFAEAAKGVRKLMFLEKFAIEIAHIFEHIEG